MRHQALSVGFNCANTFVPCRAATAAAAAAAAAAEPGNSAPCAGKELRGLPAGPSAVETPANSGDRGTEIVKESSGSREISEGTELNYIDREVMHLIL